MNPNAGPEGLAHLRGTDEHGIGVLDEDLDRAHRIGHPEEYLGGLQRHVDETAVVLVHADVEERGDLIGLHARDRADDRCVALRRDQLDPVAHPQTERRSQTLAHHQAVLRSHVVDGSGDDVVRDDGSRLQLFLGDAAHQRAGRPAARSRRHNLPAHLRRRQRDPGHGLKRGVERLVVLDHPGGGVDRHVAVHAQDPAQQFLPEAVHHRHDDDQSRHAQADAKQRETRDDGDEAFLLSGAQVAPSHHALEDTEQRAAPSKG